MASSDNSRKTMDCASTLFCVPISVLDDSVESVGYIGRSFASPQNLNQVRKRYSKQQTYVKSKTSRLDMENVTEKSDNDTQCFNSSSLMSSKNVNPVKKGEIPLSGHMPKKLVLPESSSEASTGLLKRRCDTLELCRSRKVRAAKSETRDTGTRLQFGQKFSLPLKPIAPMGGDNLLQLAQPAVYLSSSTACISPVRKACTEIKTNGIGCCGDEPSESPYETIFNVTENLGKPKLVSTTVNTDCKSRENVSSLYDTIEDVTREKPSRGFFDTNSTLFNSTNPGNLPILQRKRSKSFSNREILRTPLLRPMEFHASVENFGNTLNDMRKRSADSSTTSGSSSSNSSSYSLNSHCVQSSSNVNNQNILTENMITSSSRSGKKSKHRNKLKSTKKLSRSLHSLLSGGCSGSLTLNHDHDHSPKKNESESIYQSIPTSLTEFKKIEHQETEYVQTENLVSGDSSKINSTSTISVFKSYSKWKTTKNNRPVISDPIIVELPPHLIDEPMSTKSNKGLSSNLTVSKLKSKSAKSLSKSQLLSCVATKDLWYNKLAQVIAEEKESIPSSTNIQVSYYDPNTAADICKTVAITSNTNARDCISIILDHLEMRDADVTKFQLWVKSSLEDSPYPLIGHEFPFAIKYNCMRETMQDCDAEQCNNLYNNGSNSGADVKCQFILRQERKPGLDGFTPENGGKKVSKKARKSPIRIHNVFKRSNSKGDALDGPSNAPPGILFEHSLAKLFEANGSALPKPIMEMLTQLFQKGPFTVGIFRKSANARLVRELRNKLDSGCPTDLGATNITAVAALFKEFLRSLPDALLCSQFYDEWLEIPRLPTVRDQISQTLLLCSRLPRANLVLLQHFLCILHHIARRSSQNMMPPSNLAVCVGPSLLWPVTPTLAFNTESSKQAPSVMEFLIERFGEVFGEAMLRIMGDPPEQDATRQDSGAEESDSLHSGHSVHSCNGRRDDSSIDSLERDLEGELSPLPRKDKMSLTNLSRDSGLTMSDTQLYTPDEEESESTSSGHSSGDKNMPYPEPRNVERVQHYPAPNNPNAIYTAVCRRSNKSPGYDEPENYYATPSREHTRVHITYSTPNYSGGNKEFPSQTFNSERLGDNSRMNVDDDSIYSVPSTDPRHKQVLEIENINSNFQRDDPMRRKSNLRRANKTNTTDGLVRTTSEESLLSKYNNHDYGMSLGAGGVAGPRSPSEERSRSPATIEYDDNASFITRDSAIRRSRSAHYLAEVRKEKLKDHSDMPSPMSRSASQDTVSWMKSRSTSHIHDEGDRSYDSSTLSDDDSTPHVSRSNSRGKECGGSGNGPWDPHTPSDSGNSRNSSFKSERTGSVCTVISAGSCSTLSSNPPSYEEALNRRSIMLLQQQQLNPASSQFNDHSIREERLKSARAKQLYADSLRLYQEEKVFGDIVRASPAHAHDVDEVDCPPPLPPKGDPPPLPPKQRSKRRNCNENTNRLKHLPPVHVETQSRKQKQSDSSSPSAGYGSTMHKTIIYTDVGPPNLPPKERTVIEVVESTSDRGRQQTVRTVAQPVVEKKSIETQTDDCDLDDDEDIRDDDSPSSDAWLSDHVTSVQVPDNTYNNYHSNSTAAAGSGNSKTNTKRSRGRPRRRDSSASQRSRSVPSRDSALNHSSSDTEDEDWEYSTSHEYPGAVNYGLRDFRNLEPELRQEISWSVSQLRAIFGESLKGAKVHPPPYRPPPAAGRAPITSYHLGAGDTFCRKSSRPQSSYGEESYV